MSRNNREFWVRQFAIDEMEIRAADAAGLDADSNFSRPRDWVWQLLEDEERLAYAAQNHAKHQMRPGQWTLYALSAIRLPLRKSRDLPGVEGRNFAQQDCNIFL
jgi:hypothetical protein